MTYNPARAGLITHFKIDSKQSKNNFIKKSINAHTDTYKKAIGY